MDLCTWNTASVDCTGVFISNKYPTIGDSINLSFLDKIRADDEEEYFFPKRPLYVRQEMIDTLQQLTAMDRKTTQILIGSPGVGNSLLLFLTALWQAAVQHKPVLYIRKTMILLEDISVFYMTPTDEHLVSVIYSRDVHKATAINMLEMHFVKNHIKSPYSDYKRHKRRGDMLLFLDGPKYLDVQNEMYNYLSTSAGCDTPSSEQEPYLGLVVLSAWKKLSLRSAFDALQLVPSGDTDAANEKFDEMYFHTGGRIREAIRFLNNSQSWIKDKTLVVNTIDQNMAKLAVTSTKSSISEKSMDRLRTIFEERGRVGPHQIVDSQFYARLLRVRLGAEQSFDAFKFALGKKLMTAAGCHFEEMIHEILGNRNGVDVLQSTGSGVQGVSELTRRKLYWIPSVPNFANIDAAYVDEYGSIWCFQFTVSKDRTFNVRTFQVKFKNPVCRVLGLNSDSVPVNIVFVVPDFITSFKIPDSATEEGYTCTTVVVDCSSIDTVGEVDILAF